MAIMSMVNSWALLAQDADNVGGGFAVDTLERLLAVSPTLAVVASAAFFITRFQSREVKSKDREIKYLRDELIVERMRNEAMDKKIEALTEQVRELKDEVHWLRRHVPMELLTEESDDNATEES